MVDQLQKIANLSPDVYWLITSPQVNGEQFLGDLVEEKG
jgi:hypothetical protein